MAGTASFDLTGVDEATVAGTGVLEETVAAGLLEATSTGASLLIVSFVFLFGVEGRGDLDLVFFAFRVTAGATASAATGGSAALAAAVDKRPLRRVDGMVTCKIRR